MQINKISTNTFGMARVSNEIKKTIEQGRSQVKGTNREKTFEKNVQMIRDLMPDAYVETSLEPRYALFGKLFRQKPIALRENVFVNGVNRTYIEGIPVEGNHSARRVECLAHILRNIDNYDRLQREIEKERVFKILDDALDI